MCPPPTHLPRTARRCPTRSPAPPPRPSPTLATRRRCPRAHTPCTRTPQPPANTPTRPSDLLHRVSYVRLDVVTIERMVCHGTAGDGYRGCQSCTTPTLTTAHQYADHAPFNVEVDRGAAFAQGHAGSRAPLAAPVVLSPAPSLLLPYVAHPCPTCACPDRHPRTLPPPTLPRCCPTTNHHPSSFTCSSIVAPIPNAHCRTCLPTATQSACTSTQSLETPAPPPVHPAPYLPPPLDHCSHSLLSSRPSLTCCCLADLPNFPIQTLLPADSPGPAPHSVNLSLPDETRDLQEQQQLKEAEGGQEEEGQGQGQGLGEGPAVREAERASGSPWAS